MEKRGQVTLFIILGIVIFALIALLFYARQTIFFQPTPENLRKELGLIQEHVEDCIRNGADNFGAEQLVLLIGQQGGYINTTPDSYILYNGSRISYLCYNVEDKSYCYNRLRLKDSIEEELAVNIKNVLDQCLNVKRFSRFKNYDVIEGRYKVDVDIRRDDVLVKLNYPITLRRDENEVSISEFSAVLNYPLGDLYEVAQDIIDLEAQTGDFPTLEYMLLEKGKFRIYRNLPYPDKIYILKREDNDYMFQFAIQGEVRD